ncbi:hypothetical protein [Chitinophaga nivalis]|uniref:Uncharacterized protein n=1 Tax=Chitinophaga nivalis TaxID=2991709 RepID=A0ABT3IPP7_9BACT|nr:hypothetical protein [Chitinophaga nivalis]MCW3464368.1 hypothetical protein [Chitinophaga nivalis]MCW3485941.1 hypothetical protein [Chitinophaga nivalis]
MNTKFSIFGLLRVSNNSFPHIPGEHFSLFRIGNSDYSSREEALADLNLILSGEHPSGDHFNRFDNYTIQEVFSVNK